MPLNLRLYHTGVSGMREMFEKKVESHRQLQLENPFSEWGEEEAPTKRRLSKDDKYYGRPLPGSESEKRAQIAQHHIMMDIKYLCDMMWDCAEWKFDDGRAGITFGKLFNRRDDEKVVELTRSINTIRRRFGVQPLATGGEAEAWSLSGDEEDKEGGNAGRGRRQSTPVISTKGQKSKVDLRHPHLRRSSLPCQGSQQRLLTSRITFGSLEEEEDTKEDGTQSEKDFLLTSHGLSSENCKVGTSGGQDDNGRVDNLSDEGDSAHRSKRNPLSELLYDMSGGTDEAGDVVPTAEKKIIEAVNAEGDAGTEGD